MKIFSREKTFIIENPRNVNPEEITNALSVLDFKLPGALGEDINKLWETIKTFAEILDVDRVILREKHVGTIDGISIVLPRVKVRLQDPEEKVEMRTTFPDVNFPKGYREMLRVFTVFARKSARHYGKTTFTYEREHIIPTFKMRVRGVKIEGSPGEELTLRLTNAPPNVEVLEKLGLEEEAKALKELGDGIKKVVITTGVSKPFVTGKTTVIPLKSQIL